MAEMDEGDLLSDCPYCGYLLRGLPIEHVCPECGSSIDRRCKAFGGRWADRRAGGWVRLRRVFFLAATTYLVVGVLVARGFQNLPITAMVVLLGLAAYMAYRAFRRSSRFVLVGPEGVDLYKGKTRLTRYEWSDVGRAHFDLNSYGMVIMVTGKREKIGFSFLGWSVAEVDLCSHAINSSPYRDGIDADK